MNNNIIQFQSDSKPPPEVDWMQCAFDAHRIPIWFNVNAETRLDAHWMCIAVSMWMALNWKAVHGGQFGLPLTLERSQRASRWANHAITRQQSIDSKIYRIVIQDIVALHLLCSFQHLVFSRCGEMRVKDIHTQTHIQTHTHGDYRMPRGSAHRGITIQWKLTS